MIARVSLSDLCTIPGCSRPELLDWGRVFSPAQSKCTSQKRPAHVFSAGLTPARIMRHLSGSKHHAACMHHIRASIAVLGLLQRAPHTHPAHPTAKVWGLRGMLALAVAGAALLGFQIEATNNMTEDVVLSPAARASPVATALGPAAIAPTVHPPAACCQLVQSFMRRSAWDPAGLCSDGTQLRMRSLQLSLTADIAQGLTIER